MSVPGYEGFGDIGAVLAGAGADRQGAWIKGAQQGATLDAALSRAKIARDQALQREGLRDKIAAAMPGAPPEQVELIAALTQGSSQLGSGFSSSMQGIGRMQGVQGQNAAMALPLPGAPGYVDETPDMLNQILAASGANGPITPAQVQVMPQVESKLATEGARRKVSEASAAKHSSDAENNRRKTSAQVDTERARRDNVGKTKPRRGKDEPAGEVEKTIGDKTYVKRNGKWYQK